MKSAKKTQKFKKPGRKTVKRVITVDPTTLPLVFSGDNSTAMWNAIDNAKSVEDLRWAVYELAVLMQGLEQRYASYFKRRDK